MRKFGSPRFSFSHPVPLCKSMMPKVMQGCQMNNQADQDSVLMLPSSNGATTISTMALNINDTQHK